MDDRRSWGVQHLGPLLHGGQRQRHEDGRLRGQRELSSHQLSSRLWRFDDYLCVPGRDDSRCDTSVANCGKRPPVDSEVQTGGAAFPPRRSAEPRVDGLQLLQCSGRGESVVLDVPHGHDYELYGEDHFRDGGVHGPEF